MCVHVPSLMCVSVISAFNKIENPCVNSQVGHKGAEEH